MVGHIIGPGGANLRHIFDTTGCKIKFIQARANGRSSTSAGWMDGLVVLLEANEANEVLVLGRFGSGIDQLNPGLLG